MTARRPLGVDELLDQVREGLDRVEAKEAYAAEQAGEGLLVDIRYAALRKRDGLIARDADEPEGAPTARAERAQQHAVLHKRGHL